MDGMNGLLTQERLKQVLDYESETGIFRWKKAHRGTRADRLAGTDHKEGYISINIDYRLYLAHRLAWLYVYGELPASDVDHVNRDRSDNRISNLRLATRKQNMENQGLRSDNTSGHKGVSWDARRKKWLAQIRHNKQTIFLGRHDCIDKALSARAAAESMYFTHSGATA